MNEYIKLNNKKEPLTSFKVKHDSTDKLQNAGLFLNEGVVLVDFDGDNVNDAEIITYLKENYPTQTVETTRGVHLYYSVPNDIEIKNGSDKITVGGFQCDFKTGRNSYAVVKLDGIDRIGSIGLNLEGLSPLPNICYPLSNAKKLSGLTNGDGRNDNVFYNLRCVREQYDHVELHQVAEFINDVCMSDGFEKRELESLLHSVQKLNIDHKYKDMMKLADSLVKRLGVCTYKGRLYFYDGNKYVTGSLALNRAVGEFQRLKRSQFVELEYQLESIAEFIDDDGKFDIRLRNATIRDGSVTDPSTEFTPFFLDVVYDEKAFDVGVDIFLNDITRNRQELRLLLEEILGHCLMTSGFPHKAFFLLGKGRNGKSTFLEMVNEFMGQLVGNIGLSKFEDDTSLISLIGKLVNCADDIDSERIDRTKYFKSIVAGNAITVRPIYSHPVTFKNTATLIINANALPTFADKSVGLYERIVIVPFDLDLRKTNMDPNLIDKLSTDMAKSYILNLALKGMQRLKVNGKISDGTITRKAMSKYKMDTDTMGSFVDEVGLQSGVWLSEAYSSYLIYCSENDVISLGKRVFSRNLKIYGYETTAIVRDSSRPPSINRDRKIFPL